MHICVSCNYKFDNKYELEHHTLLHAEKSYNCENCEMSFLKRSELARHSNKCHNNDVIQKYGIIDRKSASGKIQYSPYARRSDNFNGYKTKELIQRKPSNNDDDIDYEQVQYDPNDSISSKWSTYSVSSSCYSRPQSIQNGFSRTSIDDITDVENIDSENLNGFDEQITNSLDDYDIFSIDILDENETFKVFNETQYNKSMDDGVENGISKTMESIDLGKNIEINVNECLISVSIEIIDKYLPPYDELFEKYLSHNNNVHINDSNNINLTNNSFNISDDDDDDDVQMLSSFE